MDAGDDVSDSASMYSVDRSVMSVRQRGVASGVPKGAVAASVAGSVAKKPADHRPVSTLKPKVKLEGFNHFSVNVVGGRQERSRFSFDVFISYLMFCLD